MPIKYSQALLTVLALVAAPAFAQDTTTGAPAEPAAEEAPAATEQPAEAAAPEAAAETPAAAAGTEAAETAPAEGEAANAEAASDEPQVGNYYVKSTQQDWTLRCIKADQGQDPCELYQLLKDDNGNSVAEMTLIPLKNGEIAAGATLVAPLETDLLVGLGFAVDNAKQQNYPFSFCAPVGCVSRMGFSEAELASLKRGSKATVSLLPFGSNPEQPVRLSLSLSGFTAAFDELRSYAEAAQSAAPASN